jgi:hypothetical protein
MSAAVSTLPRLGNVECGDHDTTVSFALYISSTPGAVLLLLLRAYWAQSDPLTS